MQLLGAIETSEGTRRASLVSSGLDPLLKALFWSARFSVHSARILLLLAAVVALALLRTTQLPLAFVVVGLLTLMAFWVFARDKTNARTWAIYIFAFVLFAQLRTIADDTGIAARYAYPISLDRAMFLGELPTLWLQDHIYNFGRVNAIDVYTTAIYLSYFFVPHLAVLLLWRRKSSLFPRTAMAIVAVYYLGLAGAFLLPTAPPWLAAQQGDITHVYRIVKDLTAMLQPGSYDRGYAVAGANPVAAMPSLHMAITVVVAFAAAEFGRTGKLIGVAYALSMAFALVYLGEHYVIDELAGLVVAAFAWTLIKNGLSVQRRPEFAFFRTLAARLPLSRRREAVAASARQPLTETS